VPVEGEGRWLDRFELVAELAAGGMATVYLGRISGAGGFQRFVGIKRLHPHLAREAEFVQMFLDEARLAARIHHPNVVPILEIGTSEQGYYIVMEYVEGDTLAQLITRSAQVGRHVPVYAASRILVDILRGLHAAHELADDDGKPLGIVHRDVSPQNILIGVDGSARLTDFGVARATSQLSTTQTGQLKGKLAYMAPEQARGQKDIDRRADVFAAGVVLWETLEGRRLFKGDGEADTLHKVLTDPILPLSDDLPAVTPELEAVLESALDRDRTRRFATAAAFADALERVAIEAGEVASHRDVASYLDAILGAEIAQRREAVRAWIARTDPTRLKSLSMPPPAPSVPPLWRRAPGPPPERTPSSGAGVASPVASTHPPPRSFISRPPPPPAPARPRVWPWAFFLVAAAAGGVGFLLRRTAGHVLADASPPPIAPEATSSIVVAMPTPSADRSATEVAGAPDSASPIPMATAAPPGPRPSHGATKPAPSTPPDREPVPDDISRNPYR
jgi:serine/threonine-protein kinase